MSKISSNEFERDPTLRLSRLYDKINPEVEGFKPVNKYRGYVCPADYRRVDEAAKAEQLAR